ncbi:unnamed protein product [Durusdinium trenchii]|uniref:Acyl carrier protein n=1 Tax=Durusdinium trenchii TaxID=1381693 RepID=A0ABP0PPP2_9DINO
MEEGSGPSVASLVLMVSISLDSWISEHLGSIESSSKAQLLQSSAMARSSTLAVILLGAALLQALTFVGPASPALRAGRAGRASLLVRRAASDETMGKVAEVIAEQLGVDKEKVTREATLTELGADSLDIVESVMALEEAFDIELPDEETTPLKNCGDVMDLIQSKL